MKTRYKFLNKNGRSIVSAHGNLKWKIGTWNTIDENLGMCSRGLHCSKKVRQAFSYIQGDILAKVEVRGKSLIQEDKECYSEMRIVQAWKWTKKDSVALSIFAAEEVLKNYEKLYPNDKRPRDAIEAARKVLERDTAKNRSAAWSAESAAAWSAKSAAKSAKSAKSAAKSAKSAAWSAAESAAWSAESAAWSVINRIDKWMLNRIKELEEIK